MRYSLLLILALTLPLTAVAQDYSTAPIIVDTAAPASTTKPATDPIVWPPNFPETAVTHIGEASTGQSGDTPATPESPTTPTAPAAPVAATPDAPATPPSPVSKLWPRDTVPIFLRSCTGYHPELVAPCTCVITTLMGQMPHDEFLKLSETDAIEHDPRLISARRQCIPGPQRKE